jgi:hypothetical protein
MPSRFDWRILVIVAAGLLVTLPCLLYGFPYYGDDSVWSVIFFKAFSQQFWSGEFYPRWLQQLNGGLGNPTAFYYAPGAYWISSLLDVVSLDHSGWRELGWSASIALITSGLAAYLWIRKTVTPNAALVASLVYLILPYHLNIDLYDRGALAELWTFVWMPLVLWSVEALIARHRFGVVLLGVSYALLIMTHLPTTLIFSVVPIVYSLYVSDSTSRLRSCLLTLLGMALGTGLSAIYLLPAMTMQEFIFHTTQGIGGHYYFGNWFLFGGLRWSGKWSEYFWAAIEVAALAAAAFGIAWFGPTDQLRKKTLFWAAIALGSFFMMTPLSKPIWQLLPTLQKVQFPFRFSTVLSISTAALVSFAFFESTGRMRSLLSALVVLLAGIWLYSTATQAYYAYPVHHLDQAVVDGINKRLQLNRDTNEFRPRWVVSIEEDELDELLSHIGETKGERNKVNVVEGQASVSVERWAPREIVLSVDSPSGATLNVSQFYFPGWAVRLDNATESKAVEPSKPGGLIRIATPAGQHRFVLELLKRWPESAGALISASALIMVLVLWVMGRRNRVRN